MPKIPRGWPPGALPRRMDSDMAAFYCGLSPTTFQREVDAGKMPCPHRVGARVVWDINDLDRAMDGGTIDNQDGRGAQSSDAARDAAEKMALMALDIR